MDDKEFRKLRREDLIEIIYQYQRREQRLLQENQVLKNQLEDRRIRMEKTGSIAEASLALSGIFQAAQKAADLYIESVKLLSEEKPAETTVKKDSPESNKTAEASQPAAQKDKKAPDADKKIPNTGPEDKQKTDESGKTPAKTVNKKPAAAASEKTDAEKKPPEKEDYSEVKQKKGLLAGKKIPLFRKTQQPESQKPAQQKMPAPNSVQEKTAEGSKMETKKPQKPASQALQEKKTEQKTETKTKASQLPAKTDIPEVKPERQMTAVNAKKAELKKNTKTAVQPKAAEGKTAAAGGDTDEFIASLKEYLGM